MMNPSLTKEVYKAAQAGLTAIHTVIPKISDQALRKKVEQQGACYQNISKKAEEMLHHNGMLPQELSAMQKATMWGAIQMHTIADASPEHIAEIMINGTTMGIVDLTKKINDLPDADETDKKFAKEYIASEEKHIEGLKAFL